MFGKEPAVFFNGIGEIIRAVVPVLLIFGFIHWTPEQTGTVMLLVGVVLVFLTTMLTRSATVPTETANKQIQAGINAPTGTTVEDVVASTK